MSNLQGAHQTNTNTTQAQALTKAKANQSLSLISASIVLKSLAFTVIDADLKEIFYLLVEDFDVSVSETRQNLRVAATVQKVQINNQLMQVRTFSYRVGFLYLFVVL